MNRENDNTQKCKCDEYPEDWKVKGHAKKKLTNIAEMKSAALNLNNKTPIREEPKKEEQRIEKFLTAIKKELNIEISRQEIEERRKPIECK